MKLYLYALARGLDVMAVEGLTGVLGEAVAWVDIDGIVVAGGWVDRTPEVTRDTLFAQDRVVRHLHAQAAALLPMRFGSSLGDENQAREFVERRRAVLQEQLELVAGREQMTLRILGATGASGAAGASGARSGPLDARGAGGADAPRMETSGRRYLEARAAKATPPEIEFVLKELRPLQRATRVERGRHPDVIASVYQLIDRGSADHYRRAVDQVAARLTNLKVRISGPSPAYAFAAL